MTCKNLIAVCSKTHLPCPYVATNGECKESEMLGHTPKVAMRNYADISKIELRDGL